MREDETAFKEQAIDFLSGEGSNLVISQLTEAKISFFLSLLHLQFSSSYSKSLSSQALLEGTKLSSSVLIGKLCCFPSCSHILVSALIHS